MRKVLAYNAFGLDDDVDCCAYLDVALWSLDFLKCISFIWLTVM